MKTISSLCPGAFLVRLLSKPVAPILSAFGHRRSRSAAATHVFACGISLCAGLLLLLGGTDRAQGQVVTLGNATFDKTSAQIPADGYWPMPHEILTRYGGYGDYSGFFRTEEFHGPEPVASVKTLRWSISMSSGIPGVQDLTTPTGPLVGAPEEWWLAVDTSGDIRVLKMVRAKTVIFQATPTQTPPVFMPGSAGTGDTWTVFDKTFTVLNLSASAGGYVNLLKLQVATTVPAGGQDVAYYYFGARRGLLLTQEGVGSGSNASGWTLLKK